MEKLEHHSKIISVYSLTSGQGKAEYAINLAAALGMIAETRVILIDMASPCGRIAEILKLDKASSINHIITSGLQIDILTLDRVEKGYIEQVKGKYRYVIVNLPPEDRELVCGIFTCSDAIHFFINSTKDDLKNGYKFLGDLLSKGLIEVLKRLKIVVNRLNIFDKLSIEEMSWLIRRDVWACVPECGILDVFIDAKGTPLVLKSRTSLYSKAVLRIAKREADKLLGLALGSGAAFGLAHIGVLRVLEQNQIEIDVISGSSIGALIASMWGLGLSSDKIELIARKLKNRLNVIRLLDFTIPISGILSGKRLKGFLKGVLGEKTFEDLQIPVKIMVYDLANREILALEKGSLLDAVYMSIAVPGILKPKVKKERMIVDGGISDPVPVGILLEKGVKKIIAVNVLPGPEDIHNRNMLLKKRLEGEENLFRTGPFYIKFMVLMVNFFRRVFTPNIFDVIMTSMQSMEYMLAENSCKKASLALHAVFSDATSIDFHLVKKFIKKGEEEATLHLDEIKELALR